MTISFNEISPIIRTPGIFVEFDNSQAVQGPSLFPYKQLVVGQRLSTGTVAAEVPTRVTSAAQAITYFGAGSMLAQMLEFHFKINKWTETWVIALDDDAEGTKAAGTLTVGGTVTAGTIALYVGGRRLTVGVAAGDTTAEVATAIADAITTRTDLPVTAAVNGDTDTQVDLTAKHKGVAGNDIDIRHSYYVGEALPTGLTLTFSGATSGSPNPPWEWAAATSAVASYYGQIDQAQPFQTLKMQGLMPPQDTAFGTRLAGGTSNPDAAVVWDVAGETHYNFITFPYTDAANLVALEAELLSRTGPMRMIETQAISAAYGTQPGLGTLGDSRNSEHLTIMGTGGPFTQQERNFLLLDNISTYKVDAGGNVIIDRLVTTYALSPAGAEDPSYLDLNTMLTIAYLRYDFRNYMLRKYPRHKLADDGTRFGRGQKVITPKIGKAEAIARFRVWEELGLVENIEAFKETLICERNAGDVNRLDWKMMPNLVNQFRVGAVQVAFVL